jgi:hypothetical protein
LTYPIYFSDQISGSKVGNGVPSKLQFLHPPKSQPTSVNIISIETIKLISFRITCSKVYATKKVKQSKMNTNLPATA